MYKTATIGIDRYLEILNEAKTPIEALAMIKDELEPEIFEKLTQDEIQYKITHD